MSLSVAVAVATGQMSDPLLTLCCCAIGNQVRVDQAGGRKKSPSVLSNGSRVSPMDGQTTSVGQDRKFYLGKLWDGKLIGSSKIRKDKW